MGILAIIGLIILAFVALAFLGAAFLGSALPLGGLFSTILNLIFNWWILWVPILLIGVIAYVARGESNRSSSGALAAAAGFAGGVGASEIGRRLTNSENSNSIQNNPDNGNIPMTDGSGIPDQGTTYETGNLNPPNSSRDGRESNISEVASSTNMASSPQGSSNSGTSPQQTQSPGSKSDSGRTQNLYESLSRSLRAQEQLAGQEDQEAAKAGQDLAKEDETLQELLQINQKMEELVKEVHADFQDIVQHEEHIQQVMSGIGIGELQEFIRNGGDFQQIQQDIQEINRDISRIEDLEETRRRLVSQEEQLEDEVVNIINDLDQKESRLNELEEQLKPILNGVLKPEGSGGPGGGPSEGPF